MKLLTLPLLLLSIGVHANPYSGVQVQANVLNYIDAVSPTLYMLDACQSEEFMPIFLYSIEQTYKLALVRDADEYIGKYYSVTWIRKNILKQSKEDIEAINSQIEAEVPDEEEEAPDDNDNDGGF